MSKEKRQTYPNIKPHKYFTKRKVNSTDTMLATKPVLAICLIVTCSELKTMALGGVATGSINAQEAEMAAPASKGIASNLSD